MPCILKTLMPLIVILQKATCNADFPKRGILNAFKGVKVFKRGCTLGYRKEKVQIEVLSRRGMSIVHSANLKAPLPNSPHVPSLVPYHFASKILVNGVIYHPMLMKCIGLEQCIEIGVLVLMP